MNIHSFFYIVQKFLHIPDKLFIKWESTYNKFLQQLLFNTFIFKSNYSIQLKYTYFNKIINNKFMTEEHKEEFIDIFCKIQKIYLAISRFAYLYKYKKSKIVVDYDLCLIPIDMNNKNSICLLQNNNKYMFNITDLINIITTSLSNSPEFFSEPLITKNPYNNVPFNKSTLYNIYFYIRTRTLINPELIHKFFLTNFDLDKFEKENEYLIREHSIEKYVNNSPTNILYNSVLLMIRDYNYTHQNYRIIISYNFPKKQLINIMRPYLMLYYTSKYSLLNFKKNEARILLNTKLKLFHIFNPTFSRETIKIEPYYSKNNEQKYKNIIMYDDKHINFNNDNDNDNDTFLTSHLSNKKMNEENTHVQSLIFVIDSTETNISSSDDETDIFEPNENDSI